MSNEKISGIGYSGKIKVSIKSNNTTIKTQEYKNNGSVELFNFLAACLSGNYVDVESIRPKLIQGFCYQKDGDESDEVSIANATANPFKENYANYADGTEKKETLIATSRLTISDEIRPDPEKGPRENPSGTTTGVPLDNVKIYYYFTIPASQIFNNINMFCLYPTTQAKQEDFSACFLLTKTEGTDLK